MNFGVIGNMVAQNPCNLSVLSRIDYADSATCQYSECTKVKRYSNGIPKTIYLSDTTDETVIFDSIRPGILNAYPDQKIESKYGGTYYKIGFRKPVRQIHLSVYPNPFTKELFVENQRNDRRIVQIKLFDIKGRLLKNTAVNETHYLLNTIGLNSGFYILEIQLEGGTVLRRKIVKDQE